MPAGRFMCICGYLCPGEPTRGMPTRLSRRLLPVLCLDRLIGLLGSPRGSGGGSSGAGRREAYSSGYSTQLGRFVMAPLLRTKPPDRAGIAGNNHRLSRRRGHRGAISRRIYSWAPTKPPAYRVQPARYNQGLWVGRGPRLRLAGIPDIHAWPWPVHSFMWHGPQWYGLIQ